MGGDEKIIVVPAPRLTHRGTVHEYTGPLETAIRQIEHFLEPDEDLEAINGSRSRAGAMRRKPKPSSSPPSSATRPASRRG
jgi:hypothetical protein